MFYHTLSFILVLLWDMKLKQINCRKIEAALKVQFLKIEDDNHIT